MFLATVIFMFIEFDVLTHFQKICMIIHVYKIGLFCSTISYIRMDIYGTNWVNFSNSFMKISQKSPISQTITICGSKTNMMTCHFLFVFLLGALCK